MHLGWTAQRPLRFHGDQLHPQLMLLPFAAVPPPEKRPPRTGPAPVWTETHLDQRHCACATRRAGRWAHLNSGESLTHSSKSSRVSMTSASDCHRSHLLIKFIQTSSSGPLAGPLGPHGSLTAHVCPTKHRTEPGSVRTEQTAEKGRKKSQTIAALEHPVLSEVHARAPRARYVDWVRWRAGSGRFRG